MRSRSASQHIDQERRRNSRLRPLIGVVVLNWNGWRDTLPCLDSIRHSTYCDHVVVVVDNGSSDNSSEIISAAHPNAHVIHTGTNLGFAKGCNVGIRHALNLGVEGIWLLNNDTKVSPNCLEAMVLEMLTRTDIGIVGSVVRPWFEGEGSTVWGGGQFRPWSGLTKAATPHSAVDFITGASMLLRRQLLEEVGLLDERFFFYMEDVDLCHRARRRGWAVSVAQDSEVRHKTGGTSGASDPRSRPIHADLWHARSSGVLLSKHSGWLLPFGLVVRLSLMAARRVAHGQSRRLPPITRFFLKGVRQGLGAKNDLKVDCARSGT